MDELAYYVPRRLDAPAKLLFWEIDEFMTVLGSLALGLSIGSMLVAIACPIAGLMLLSRIKAGGGPGYMKRLFYWHMGGGQALGLIRTPPSHLREFVG